MARSSVGYSGFVTLMDSGGNKTTKSFEMSVATAADAETAMAALVADLDAVTDAKVMAYGVVHNYAESDTAYPATGEIEEQALLTLAIDGQADKKATLTIPAPTIGIFVASSGANKNVVDIADTVLLDYVNHFLVGGEFRISDGEVGGTLEKGKRIHRASRKG